MIEVIILKNGEPLATVEIKNVQVHSDGTADYRVLFAVERGSAVGIHRRPIFRFPRKRLNALALLRQALNTLDEKELELERDFNPDETTVSTDLARRLRGAMREIQREVSRLHRH
jgi:hypothetical protein